MELDRDFLFFFVVLLHLFGDSNYRLGLSQSFVHLGQLENVFICVMFKTKEFHIEVKLDKIALCYVCNQKEKNKTKKHEFHIFL